MDNLLSVKEALRTHKFYHISLMLFCSTFYGMFMASSFKNLGSNDGDIDDLTLTVAGSLGAFMNGACRILWATL
jgi:hypothetical protein